ncbi:MAG: hypothetical protein E7221_05485 [Clostridiales bacterium]|nr:hypothetical protein [Clostridiales bacterium]
MVELILKAIITSAAGAFVGAVIVWIKGMLKKQQEFEAALKALAHDSFYRQCRYLLGQDTISESELENLNYLHDAYTSLGLNGTGEELYKRCLEKKIK